MINGGKRSENTYPGGIILKAAQSRRLIHMAGFTAYYQALF